MKKSIRTLFIVMIATMTVALAAVVVNANGRNITDINLSADSGKHFGDSVSIKIKPGKRAGLYYSYKRIGDVNADKDIVWTTSNSKVAKVSDGVITGVKDGKATIVAKARDNGKVKATCKVTVKSSHGWVNADSAYTELNKLRKNRKFKALKRDAALEKIAETRAKEMAEHNKFSHTRPNGKSGLTLIKGNKYKGENIAKGQKNGKAVTKAWYNSKGHRANMLCGNAASKHFTKVGIACYEINGVTYWAQVFSS